MAGQNRSVTVTVAFVMYFENKSLRESFEFVRVIRRNVCPFRDNREELVRYERTLRGSNSMSVDDFVHQFHPAIGKVSEEAPVHRSSSEDNLISQTVNSSRLKKPSKGIPPEFLTGSCGSVMLSTSTS